MGSNTICLFAIFSLTFFFVTFVCLVRVNDLSHAFRIVERKENLVESIVPLPLQPQHVSVIVRQRTIHELCVNILQEFLMKFYLFFNVLITVFYVYFMRLFLNTSFYVYICTCLKSARD